MTALASFTATTTWQELTGVSDVANIFTIQNRNNRISCLLQLGDEPVDDSDAFLMNPEEEKKISNIDNTEKVWIKSLSETVIIVINEA